LQIVDAHEFIMSRRATRTRCKKNNRAIAAYLVRVCDAARRLAG
jgi:hypothetical protein